VLTSVLERNPASSALSSLSAYFWKRFKKEEVCPSPLPTATESVKTAAQIGEIMRILSQPPTKKLPSISSRSKEIDRRALLTPEEERQQKKFFETLDKLLDPKNTLTLSQLKDDLMSVSDVLNKNPEVKALVEKQLKNPSVKDFATDFKNINPDTLTPGFKEGRAEQMAKFKKLGWTELYAITKKFQ
jgi:hypothetical protein